MAATCLVRVGLVGGVFLAAVVLAGCGGSTRSADPAVGGDRFVPGLERPSVGLPRSATDGARRQDGGCAGGSPRAVGSRDVSFAAVARGPSAARRRPNGVVLARFGRFNENGHVTVFLIRAVLRDGCGRVWYRVSLPVRPNGATGFVMARNVRVVRVETRIVVDLSDREMTLYRSAKPVIRSRVAVGSADTPTPTGRYYVNQRLLTADPTGPWGPGAIGVSAFSEVLRDWPQGGPIAIHGTGDPRSIGQAASYGCVRLPNGTLRRMFAATPAGTPVHIRE